MKLCPTSMASSDVSLPEMGEVVIVTIPDTVSEDLSSVVEEEKAVLVAAELTPHSGCVYTHTHTQDNV